jgi:hypothetical protein
LISGFPLRQDYSGQSHLTVFFFAWRHKRSSIGHCPSRDDLVVVGSL